MSKLELNENTGLYEIEGSFADLLYSLSDKMNFTFTMKPPPDNKWGSQNADGTWNGMIYLVRNELTDFGTFV